MKIRLWLQRPPRVQWVLRVVHQEGDTEVNIRTWVPEYPPHQHPPAQVVKPVAIACARIALAAAKGALGDSKYQVELRNLKP